MRTLILLALILILMWATEARSQISEEYINDSIIKAAEKEGVPAVLLKAVCTAESNLKTESYVYNDGGEGNHAIGICQVLLRTAGDYGFRDERCSADFRSRLHERVYKHCKLFGPYTNASYAAKFLKSKLDEHKGSWISAISTYNSGTLRACSERGYYTSYRDGIEKLSEPRKVPCIPGELLNRRYVDKVKEYISKAQLQKRIEEGEK